MIFELTVGAITLIVLAIASYTDLTTREVPDWISYAFIFTAAIVRILFSLELGWEILMSGAVGFLITFAFALLFYFTGQWGGADSKLLMGMGVVLGADFLFMPDAWLLPIYFVTLLFVGALFGLLWSTILAIIHHKRFWSKFKNRLKEYRREHIGVLVVTIILVVVGFFTIKALMLIGLFPLLSYYLFVYVSSIEQSCFIKKIMPHRATEGDWLVEDVKVGKKTVIKAATLEKKHLRKLLDLEAHDKIDRIVIKEGIPFIPSFLLAYIVILFGEKIFPYVVGLLF